MDLKARLYLAIVFLGSLAILVTQSSDLHFQNDLIALLLLTLGSFFTQVYELEVQPNWFFSTHVAIATTAVFIGGLPLAIWVAVLSTLPAEVLLRWDHLKSSFPKFASPVLFNTGQVIICTATAAVVYSTVRNLFPSVDHPYYAMAVSFAAYLIANNVLLTTIISLTSHERYLRIFRTGIRNSRLEFITLGVLAILMTTLYRISPAHLALAFVPVILVHYSTSNHLRLHRESHLAFKRITDLLAERDEYTGLHSDEVETLAVRLADAVKLRDDEVEAVRLGAAVHDIGKIAIPDAILKKLGPLSDAEFEIMKQHTVVGAKVIENLSIYRKVVPIVLHEHEHWDGSGYPGGLREKEIPIGARVVAVADVYSALTTERAYRPPQGKPLSYSHEEACEILMEMAGSILDPALVPTFVGIVETEVAPLRGDTQ